MFDPSAEQVNFGNFVLDFPRGELLRSGEPVPLRRQAFVTLHYLIKHHGRIVSNTELAQAVWTSPRADPDASIVQCIKEIRRALGADGARMIGTVTGIGYEFKSEVVTLQPEVKTPKVESEIPDSYHATLVRWIARRPGLAVTAALATGVVLLTVSLVLAWFIVSSISHPDTNQPAMTVTCSQGKLACMRTGGEEQTCEGRRQRCLATGCWMGGLVQRCGYEGK
jgi:DNA-binding winged helix-turn-helix (wHTH) protein